MKKTAIPLIGPDVMPIHMEITMMITNPRPTMAFFLSICPRQTARIGVIEKQTPGIPLFGGYPRPGVDKCVVDHSSGPWFNLTAGVVPSQAEKGGVRVCAANSAEKGRILGRIKVPKSETDHLQ
jgi:hypothetical protein